MTALMGKKAQDAIGLAKTNEFPPQLTVCCHKVGSTENGVAYHDPGLVTSDWCLQEEHEWRKLLFIKGRGCIQFAKSFKVTLAFIIETVVRCAHTNEISFDLNKKKKTLPNQGSWKLDRLYKCLCGVGVSVYSCSFKRAAENSFEERCFLKEGSGVSSRAVGGTVEGAAGPNRCHGWSGIFIVLRIV